MSVVIADTSPLNYLILIDAIEILPRLYERIKVPPEVLSELLNPGTPLEVSRWIQNRPERLDVESVPTAEALHSKNVILVRELRLCSPCMNRTCSSSSTTHPDVKPRVGLEFAQLEHSACVARQPFIDLPIVLARLLRTNFRVPNRLVEDLIAQDDKRRSN